MNLVNANDPILTTRCNDFDFNNTPFDPIEFSKELVKFMYDSNGIGLAANQVGVPYRIFAMRGQPENFVCFNPRVVQPSEMQVVLEEGCLTYPNVFVKVKRPRHVRVRFDTPYLREPLHYDMNILPKDEFMPYMHESLKFMKDNLDDSRPDAFSTMEYEKFKRVVDYMAETQYSEEKLIEGRRDFYNWFNELDERRETDMLSVFPEYIWGVIVMTACLYGSIDPVPSVVNATALPPFDVANWKVFACAFTT